MTCGRMQICLTGCHNLTSSEEQKGKGVEGKEEGSTETENQEIGERTREIIIFADIIIMAIRMNHQE